MPGTKCIKPIDERCGRGNKAKKVYLTSDSKIKVIARFDILCYLGYTLPHIPAYANRDLCDLYGGGLPSSLSTSASFAAIGAPFLRLSLAIAAATQASHIIPATTPYAMIWPLDGLKTRKAGASDASNMPSPPLMIPSVMTILPSQRCPYDQIVRRLCFLYFT